MPRFAVRYQASPDHVRDIVVEAPRWQMVADTLQVQQSAILTLVEVKTQVSRPPAPARLPTDRRFPLRTFCTELAILLDSGIALYEALETLRDKERDTHVSMVIADLTRKLEHGQTFSQALGAHPSIFGALFIATIEASQRTGQIPDALRRHGDYLTWLGRLRDKLVTACIYPAVLLIAGFLVLTFLTVFVVPRFAQIYDDLGGELPILSRALMQVGSTVNDHPLGISVILGTALGACIVLFRTTAFRQWVASRLWRLPYLGDRLRLMDLAGLYRTLGLLLQAGVPVVPAMEACHGMAGAALGPELCAATQKVREGERLSDSLERHGLGTVVSVRMLRVGEHTGELGSMLERAAMFYDEELVRFTEWVGKVVNPLLMLVMGLLVGGVVVLMYLPIFQVAEQVQ